MGVPTSRLPRIPPLAPEVAVAIHGHLDRKLTQAQLAAARIIGQSAEEISVASLHQLGYWLSGIRFIPWLRPGGRG